MKRHLEANIETAETPETAPTSEHAPSTDISFLKNAFNHCSRLKDKKKFTFAAVGTKGVGKSAYLNTLLNEGKSESWPLFSALGPQGLTLNFTYISHAEGDFRAVDEKKNELFAVKEMIDILKEMKGLRVKGKIFLSGPFPSLPKELTLIDCPGWDDVSLIEFHEVLRSVDAIAVLTARLASRDDMIATFTLADGARNELPPLFFNVFLGSVNGFLPDDEVKEWQAKVDANIKVLPIERKGNKTKPSDLLQYIREHRQKYIESFDFFFDEQKREFSRVVRQPWDRKKTEAIKENTLAKLRSELTLLNWKKSDWDFPLSHPPMPVSQELVRVLNPMGVLMRCYFSLLTQARLILEDLFEDINKAFHPLPSGLLEDWDCYWNKPNMSIDIEVAWEKLFPAWEHVPDDGEKNWVTIQTALLPVKESLHRRLGKIVTETIDELDVGIVAGF